jgi:hypothetical protein
LSDLWIFIIFFVMQLHLLEKGWDVLWICAQ